MVRIAPESRKPLPNPTGEPWDESLGRFETHPVLGLPPVPTHSLDETKAIASPNEQGRTDPSGRNKVCFSQHHSTTTTTSLPQSHSPPVEMDRAQIQSRASLDQSNSSTLGFQQGSTLNGPDSPPKTTDAFLGNSHNLKTDISTRTGGETTATQSHHPLTDCHLPLGNPTEQHTEIDAQSTPPELDSGVSMSRGRSQTGQPISATPSGTPLGLKHNVSAAEHSLRPPPPQSVRTLRSAPSTNNDSGARLNNKLSVAGHSAHTGTRRDQRPYPHHHSLPSRRSRSPVSVQPLSHPSMTGTHRNQTGSRHHRSTASIQPSQGGSCAICSYICSCIRSCCKGNVQ